MDRSAIEIRRAACYMMISRLHSISARTNSRSLIEVRGTRVKDKQKDGKAFGWFGRKGVAWKLRYCRGVTSYISVQDTVRGIEFVSKKIVRMEDDVMMKKSRTRRSTGTEELSMTGTVSALF